MNDSSFSITNMLFYLYHSWIDLALETKARLIRQSDRSQIEYEEARDYMGNLKNYSILNQVVNSREPITWG